MNVVIDPRAIVSAKAQLGGNVSVGPFSIVEDNVIVGEGTHIASAVLIASGARIGKECRIHHGAVVGTIPQDLKFHGEQTVLEIGDHTTIREYATLNRGTSERGKTTVGHHCFIMAYAHIAHDCSIGNHVILANSVNMAGHVSIEDHVVIGGMVPIHQFVRIGCHAMVGGGYRVTKDIPPYILAGHEPLTFQGLNIVGLKRRSFSPDAISQLEKLYDLVYRSQYNVTQALAKIKTDFPMSEEILHVIDFIQNSKRGIIWGRV